MKQLLIHLQITLAQVFYTTRNVRTESNDAFSGFAFRAQRVAGATPIWFAGSLSALYEIRELMVGIVAIDSEVIGILLHLLVNLITFMIVQFITYMVGGFITFVVKSYCFYGQFLLHLWFIFSNYWMRLSRIWRILQVEESVIHRGRRWITASEICRILHILRKPNSIIALLFIQNIIFAQTCKLLAAISIFVEWQSLVPRFSRSMVQ